MFSDSLSFRTPMKEIAATPMTEVVAPAYISPVVLEIGISQAYALAGTYGYGVPAVAGSGRRNSYQAQKDDPFGTSPLTTAYLDWAVPPTAPSCFCRRATIVASIGSGIIWTFPRGMFITRNTSVVLWAIAPVPSCDVWFQIDE